MENDMQAMIPGINNLHTIGSSPLKRGAKNDLALPRDHVYASRGGAGQVSSKVNSAAFLPAMNRGGAGAVMKS